MGVNQKNSLARANISSLHYLTVPPCSSGENSAMLAANKGLEEVALVIGGLAAVHEMEDDLIWRLMKNLDVIRGKVLRRLDDRTLEGGVPERRPNLKPHPAIEDFLLNLRRK